MLASREAAGRHARRYVVSGAFSASGHGFTAVHGWGDWRKRLRNACVSTPLAARGTTGAPRVLCRWSYQQPTCKECLGAREAVELYAQSVFCLQPPGDVIARGAIFDAISVGCVPVFFLRGQAALWPWHWNASAASVLFDWQADGAARNGSAVMQALLALYESGAARAMQAAVVAAAQSMTYRDRGGPPPPQRRQPQGADALDVLVERAHALSSALTSARAI